MVEYNYLYLNDIGYSSYNEIDIPNRKDFDLTTKIVKFVFEDYICVIENNNRNKVVEMFVERKNSSGHRIEYKNYYMSTGYFCFLGSDSNLLIYIDLTRRGYLGSVDNI